MASSSRSDLLRMGAFLGALLLVTGVVLLVTGGGGSGASQPQVRTLDGRLTSVQQTELTLQPDGGGPVERFTVRPIDRRTLDLPHLQTHMAQGLPSRVLYETDGAERYAVRVDDLPPPSTP
jgi:hypothetical protein